MEAPDKADPEERGGGGMWASAVAGTAVSLAPGSPTSLNMHAPVPGKGRVGKDTRDRTVGGKGLLGRGAELVVGVCALRDGGLEHGLRVGEHPPSRSRGSKSPQMRAQRSEQAAKLATQAAGACSGAARDPTPPAETLRDARL